MNYLLFATAIAALFGIGLLTMMGVSYHVEGQGLHPALVSVGIVVLSVAGFKACSMVCDPE